jgi:hypothetical protein
VVALAPHPAVVHGGHLELGVLLGNVEAAEEKAVISDRSHELAGLRTSCRLDRHLVFLLHSVPNPESISTGTPIWRLNWAEQNSSQTALAPSEGQLQSAYHGDGVAVFRAVSHAVNRPFAMRCQTGIIIADW